MPKFSVTWAIGDNEEIEAHTAAQAHELVREFMPRGGSWIDVDVAQIKDDDH